MTLVCVATGSTQFAYMVDKRRIHALGPVVYTGQAGDGHGWTTSPHVYAA